MTAGAKSGEWRRTLETLGLKTSMTDKLGIAKSMVVQDAASSRTMTATLGCEANCSRSRGGDGLETGGKLKQGRGRNGEKEITKHTWRVESCRIDCRTISAIWLDGVH